MWFGSAGGEIGEVALLVEAAADLGVDARQLVHAAVEGRCRAVFRAADIRVDWGGRSPTAPAAATPDGANFGFSGHLPCGEAEYKGEYVVESGLFIVDGRDLLPLLEAANRRIQVARVFVAMGWPLVEGRLSAPERPSLDELLIPQKDVGALRERGFGWRPARVPAKGLTKRQQAERAALLRTIGVLVRLLCKHAPRRFTAKKTEEPSVNAIADAYVFALAHS